MNWEALTTFNEEQIRLQSKEKAVIIFKHSIRCSISAMVLNRLERQWNSSEMEGAVPYFLDLISYRQVSSAVAKTYNVVHQSPQVLVIQDGKCIYNSSHTDISYEKLKSLVKEIKV